MDNIIQADIFFFVTTIFIVVATIILIVSGIYIIKSLREIREGISVVKAEALEIVNDSRSFRSSVKEKGRFIRKIAKIIFHAKQFNKWTK